MTYTSPSFHLYKSSYNIVSIILFARKFLDYISAKFHTYEFFQPKAWIFNSVSSLRVAMFFQTLWQPYRTEEFSKFDTLYWRIKLTSLGVNPQTYCSKISGDHPKLTHSDTMSTNTGLHFREGHSHSFPYLSLLWIYEESDMYLTKLIKLNYSTLLITLLKSDIITEALHWFDI